jgi:hypothetical protein
MVRLLWRCDRSRAVINADHELLSNGCATTPSVSLTRRLILLVHTFAVILATAELAAAQEPVGQVDPSSTTSEYQTASAFGKFLAGAAVGLGAHEGGHLLFDAIFDANPRVTKVSFHGIPFFAITHDGGLSPRKEFVIDSAGFWVQEATNEVLLSRRPNLRHEHAPFAKGVFAFNVGTSIAYAGAAFARTGPSERDTRGMADALGWKEPYVGVLILVPAVLDLVRFYHPDQRWAVWGSRVAKIGGVALVAK